MDLVVFDLDGTLLNRQSIISDYTRETLALLRRRNVAYTVATGRTLHASRDLLEGHGFDLPHILKNGVVIWSPAQACYSERYLLTPAEIEHVMHACIQQGLAPFVFTLEQDDSHAVYHAPQLSAVEEQIARQLRRAHDLPVHPLSELPATAGLTNISALGPARAIEAITALITDEPDLVAYTGIAIEDESLRWIDVHHRAGSKGDAVARLKENLEVDRVICFGDSDNDLSMFALADECYAPENAREDVKAVASEIIGHHDEDGIARFLRRRFAL